MRRLLTLLTRRRLIWRLFLLVLFTVPLILVVPHLRSLVVRNAVVTAYSKGLRAPIDGTIVEISLSPGQTAKAGQPVMRIHNSRVDRSRVARLQALRDETAQRVSTQREVVAALHSRAGARQSELKRYASSLTDDLETHKDILVARRAAAQAAVTEAEDNLARARELRNGMNMSRAEVDQAETKFQEAVATRTQIQLELARIDQQLDDVQEGIFQTDVPDGALQTLALSQGLDFELIRQERELGLLKAELLATESELDAAREFLALQSEATILMPEGTTVWAVEVTQGDTVRTGTKLLSYVDCSDLLVDIAIDDATLELIRPRQVVRLRLFGRTGYAEGVVRLVRGSAALDGSDDLVAEVQNRTRRAGRVLASIDDPGLSSDSGRTCGIGRTAYAEFEEISFFETVFLPLLR